MTQKDAGEATPGLLAMTWEDKGEAMSGIPRDDIYLITRSNVPEKRMGGTAAAMTYYVYLLTNKSNNVLYVGVTGDLIRRVYEHKHHLDPNSFTAKYNVTKLGLL